VFHVKHRASTAELLFREVITTMAGETVITLVGNLVDDPELRFTPSGAAVAKFRIASTPRTFDRQTNEWKDGESLFLTCNVWRQPAENVAESLQRGMRVIVQGRLRQRSYETKEGEKRTVFEVEVDEVGPSLRSATAKVTRANRGPGGGGGSGFGGAAPQQGGGGQGNWGGGGQGGSGSGSQGGGNWGGNSGGGQSGPSDDPWASSAPAGGNSGGGSWGAPSGGGYSEEPPF
jgi:single-strand DNA-binding protein